MFYVIQLLPTDAPWIVKLGFSIEVQSRLLTHRITCPDARLVKVYACEDTTLEKQAQAFLSKSGFECIGGEVFRCPVLSDLLMCLDYFFTSPYRDPYYAPPPLDSRYPRGARDKLIQGKLLNEREHTSLLTYLYDQLKKTQQERDQLKKRASQAETENIRLGNGKEVKTLRRDREYLRQENKALLQQVEHLTARVERLTNESEHAKYERKYLYEELSKSFHLIGFLLIKIARLQGVFYTEKGVS